MCAIRLYQAEVPLITDMELLKDAQIDKVDAELLYSI